jgi:ATP-dependent helicase HepA
MDARSMDSRQLSPGALVTSANGWIGRVQSAANGEVKVAYFDAPGNKGTLVRTEPITSVRPATLAPQTRVHWRENGGWEHGRVIEHHPSTGMLILRSSKTERRLSDKEIIVRPRRRLTDATLLLADRWVESRRYHDGRHDFVEAYLRRASAYQEITAIASAAIEAHPHQLEAVRRVLADPVQRYLLADEVGLGKTIEAGLLIRQHLLDRPDHRVLVIVPPSLRGQWLDELETKFRVFTEFPGACTVSGNDRLASCVTARPTLLVVDEAHRITADDSGSTRYDCLRELASRSPALLLLTATPLLQSNASLQRLLVLLTPGAPALEDPKAFENALARRDEIATSYGSLSDDIEPVFLRQAIEGLRNVLADDAYVQRLLDDVAAAIPTAESGDELKDAVRRARAHISDAHRIYARMIRTRRGAGLAEDFPVLGRFEPTRILVSDAITTVAPAYTVWIEHIRGRLGGCSEDARIDLAAAVSPIVQAIGTGGDELALVADTRLRATGPSAPDEFETELLAGLRDAGLERAETCPRTRTIMGQTTELLAAGEQVVVATGVGRFAEALYRQLLDAELPWPVFTIASEERAAVRAFAAATEGAVLVIGPRGEEGHNLQAATAVVHADLLWDPNRLEQRMGRFDRFGAGFGARHYVLVDDGDTPHNGWLDLLCDGFGLFRDSIASLQLAISTMLPPLILSGVERGAEGFRAEIEQVAGELAAELSAVQLAELLDETVVDHRGWQLIDGIEQAEGRAQTAEWEAAVIRWAAGERTSAANLRFHHSEESGQHRFALTRYDTPNVAVLNDADLPLVAWSELGERFAATMDDGALRGTFRRLTASHRGLRLLGPGDPFIDALWNFTETDDRGRAFALWRARDYWHADELLTICLDVRIRFDLQPAFEVAKATRGLSLVAIRRRAESYLAPLTERVWLDRELREIGDRKLLQILNAPYNDQSNDKTLRPSTWWAVDQHVARAVWPAWCARARETAIEKIFARHELTERCQEAARAAARDATDAYARLQARDDAPSRVAAAVEAALGPAIARGLAYPTAEVDAAGIVVLAHRPLMTDEDR